VPSKTDFAPEERLHTASRQLRKVASWASAARRSMRPRPPRLGISPALWASPPSRVPDGLERQFSPAIDNSEQGIKAAIELVIRHRGLAAPDGSLEPWTRQLEEALLAV
jgi:hypothetical protein